MENVDERLVAASNLTMHACVGCNLMYILEWRLSTVYIELLTVHVVAVIEWTRWGRRPYVSLM
jgi:hypothetical protein